MKTQHIVPAIIPESLDHLQTRLRDVHHVVNRVQIDVLDGSYTPTKSWPYEGVSKDTFEAIRRQDEGLPFWQDFDFEIDLMVEKPEEHIEEWALAGAACLIIHVETTKKLVDVARQCAERRLEFALALKPSTDTGALEPVIDQALFVQVMGNDRIGYHGVALDDAALATVQAVREQWPEMLIGVDIGVNEETIPKLAAVGVRRFAVGSAIFNYSAPAGAVSHLENIVAKELNE